MIDTKNSLAFLVFLSIILTSCSPVYYASNTHNVPLLKSKGEGNISFAGNPDQFELQGAYGISNGVGLLLNVGHFSIYDYNDGGTGNYLEGGLGVFNTKSGNFLFETYGIFAVGQIDVHFPSAVSANPLTTGRLSSNIFRYGLQPSFGYKKRHFEAAVSSRLVFVKYANTSGDLIYSSRDEVDFLRNTGTTYFIEPAFTLRGGWNKFKLQVQIGALLLKPNSDFNRATEGHFTIGLSYRFERNGNVEIEN